MPKAVLKTKSGAVVTIEGTQEEVADLLARVEGGPLEGNRPRASKPSRPGNSTPRPTPTGLLAELIDEGFFSVPKGLTALRVALRERGHFYPATTLSPLMLRLVRSKQLRRMKDKKGWTYVR